MNLPEAKTLLSRLSQRAPRQAVETLLEFLATDHGAQQAALFCPADDSGLGLFCARGIDQEAIDWVNATWHRTSKKLEHGLTVKEGRRALVPILYPASEILAGVLFLETDTIHEDSIFDVEVPLIAALSRAHGKSSQSPVDDYLLTTHEDEIARRKMRLMCEREGWTLSRVARQLGISRQSTYRRLETLGLSREKVVKG